MEDIQRAIGQLEGKVDGVRDMLVSLSSRLDRRDLTVDKEVEDLRKSNTSAHVRISNIERRGAYYLGLASAVMFVANHFTWLLNVASAAIR